MHARIMVGKPWICLDTSWKGRAQVDLGERSNRLNQCQEFIALSLPSLDGLYFHADQLACTKTGQNFVTKIMTDLISYQKNTYPFQSRYHLIDACQNRETNVVVVVVFILSAAAAAAAGVGGDGGGDIGDGGGGGGSSSSSVGFVRNLT